MPTLFQPLPPPLPQRVLPTPTPKSAPTPTPSPRECPHSLPQRVSHPCPTPCASGCAHHRAKRATNVPKGIAAEEPFIHKIQLRKKNTANIVLHRGRKRDQISCREREVNRMTCKELQVHTICEIREDQLRGVSPKSLSCATFSTHPDTRKEAIPTRPFHLIPPIAGGSTHKTQASEFTPQTTASYE